MVGWSCPLRLLGGPNIGPNNGVIAPVHAVHYSAPECVIHRTISAFQNFPDLLELILEISFFAQTILIRFYCMEFMFIVLYML